MQVTNIQSYVVDKIIKHLTETKSVTVRIYLLIDSDDERVICNSFDQRECYLSYANLFSDEQWRIRHHNERPKTLEEAGKTEFFLERCDDLLFIDFDLDLDIEI